MESVIATLGESSQGALSLHAANTRFHEPYESRVRLAYFAEGAANVIFFIEILHHPDNTSGGEDLSWAHRKVDGHLLRLRKGQKAPEYHLIQQPQQQQRSIAPPPFVPVKQIDEFLKDHVLQSIPTQYVVDHVLVEVHPDFIRLCNEILLNLENNQLREHKRCGWLINGEEPHGFLVADMNARNANEFTIEFKPKWLAQSPLAPPDARRCRTCAWHVKNGVAAEKRYCPLSLVSGSNVWARKEVERFVPGVNQLPNLLSREAAITALSDYFSTQVEGHAGHGLELMRLLQRLQTEWDANGAVSRVGITADMQATQSKRALLDMAQHALDNPENNQFQQLSWAMTLRDCIVFIRLTMAKTDEAVTITSKVADLDLKRVEADKLLKWTLDETDLLNQGYYTGTEELIKTEDICLLWTEQGRELYQRSCTVK